MTATDDTKAPEPSTPELVAVICAGALHVLCELTISPFAARVVSGGIVVVFIGYVLWRVRSDPGVLRRWGFRLNNFWPALGAQMGFAVLGALPLVGLGAYLGHLDLPATFLLTLAVYPLWGLAQQFALQNLIAANLPARWSAVPVALIAATLFAASHYPRLELVALTFAGGVPFTLVYRRFPNLWAVGLAHGLLGSLAFYLVLGEDPGTMILNALP